MEGELIDEPVSQQAFCLVAPQLALLHQQITCCAMSGTTCTTLAVW